MRRSPYRSLRLYNDLLIRHRLEYYGRCPCLAAARSRSGSDTTPWCHSRPSRRFATRWGRTGFRPFSRFTDMKKNINRLLLRREQAPPTGLCQTYKSKFGAPLRCFFFLLFRCVFILYKKGAAIKRQLLFCYIIIYYQNSALKYSVNIVA